MASVFSFPCLTCSVFLLAFFLFSLSLEELKELAPYCVSKVCERESESMCICVMGGSVCVLAGVAFDRGCV